MFGSTLSALIAAGILIVLALFVPCMESLAGLLRRSADKQRGGASEKSDRAYKRDIA